MRWKLMLVLALVLIAGMSATACQTTESTTMDDTSVEMPAGDDAGQAQDDQAQDDQGETAQEAAAGTDSDTATGGNSGTMTGSRTFVILPEQSMASYEADEEFLQGAVDRLGVSLGMFQAIGTTGDLTGELTVNFDGEPTIEGGEIIVNLTTLTSDNERRDDKIREEWLESLLYPEAVFTVTGAEGLPPTYAEGETITFTLLGDMTVRDVTTPVSWIVTASVNGDILTGLAETTVSIPDFGFQAPDMAGFLKVADMLTLKADLTAQAQ